MKKYVFAPFSVSNTLKSAVHQAKFAAMRKLKSELYTPDTSGIDDLLLENESCERIGLLNVLVRVFFSHKVSESSVSGMEGSLKESCGKSDLRFQVDFFCFAPMTTDGRAELYETVSDILCYLRDSLYMKVKNEYLNRLGVTNCVLLSYKVGKNQFENCLPVSLVFKSDEPIEYISL